jgi:hypothetical protein
MAPWITLHAWPNGEAFPCCAVKSQGLLNGNGMANLNTHTLLETWNSDMMKTLRTNCLNDQPTDICSKCYETEEHGFTWSLRKNLNINFAEKYFDRVLDTNDDGSHDDPRLYYWDIRFNNLCNMKCRSCGPEFSSQWFDDAKQLYAFGGKAYKGLPDTFWETALPLIQNVEYAYFAGGEPLITDEHYRMLQTWIDAGNTNLRIDYTTNFSKMSLGNKHVFDYWNQFKNVNVGASLDASYARGEYMRKGTVWNDIVKNRRDMIKECPDTGFFLAPTISAYNVWHFPDFHREWLEEGLVNQYSINLNTLLEPDYMRIQSLPYELKREIANKWEKHIEWLDDNFFKPINKEFIGTDLHSRFFGVIDFLWTKDNIEWTKTFVANNKKLDKIRKESLFEVFPELTILKEYDVE